MSRKLIQMKIQKVNVVCYHKLEINLVNIDKNILHNLLIKNQHNIK